MSLTRFSAALVPLLLLPLVSNAADAPPPPVTLPPTSVVSIVTEDDGEPAEPTTPDTPEHGARAVPGPPTFGPGRVTTPAPRMPGAAAPGAAPSKHKGILRPLAPLKAPDAPAASGQNSKAAPVSRSVTVSEDGASALALSSTALNRLLFAESIVSAYTATEAVDVIIESRTAIVSFRAARPADVMFVTQGGQYMLRLVPESLPAQTVRIRLPKLESHVTSSYQTQLADLIQAGYRRKPPEGFRTEKPNRELPMTGALSWYLTLQHRGHRLTIQEYAVANTGAVAHKADPVAIAHLFPNARAISSDPEVVPAGTWARILVVVDTESLEPPEPSK